MLKHNAYSSAFTANICLHQPLHGLATPQDNTSAPSLQLQRLDIFLSGTNRNDTELNFKNLIHRYSRARVK